MKRSLLKYGFLAIVLLTGCGADLQTKDWATENLRYYQAKEVIPNLFELRYAENTGVAFSFMDDLGAHIRLPLIFGGVLISCILLLSMMWRWRDEKIAVLLPLVLILSGAMGNSIDRLMNGYVVDFIHFHYGYDFSFPIFNIADTLVFCGVVLMMIQYFRGNLVWEEKQPESSQ